MSTKTKCPTLTFDGFGGVGAPQTNANAPSAAAITNFRIRSDGALEKRCGYRFLTDLGKPIRAFYPDLENGEPVLHVLVENQISVVNLRTASIYPIGTVGTNSGPAVFFYYEGALHLIDGLGFYEFHDGSLIPVKPYVPLVVKNWSNNFVGDIHEPRNLLTDQARLSYVVADPPSALLMTKDPVFSIDAVYLNGTRISSANYSYDESLKAISIPGLKTGDRVLAYVTYQSKNADLLSHFLTVTNATLFGSTSGKRLYFWGGDLPSTVFCSAYANPDQVADAQRQYPESGIMYIPENYEFIVGEGQYAVKDALHHNDRLLFFTEGDTWMATEDSTGHSHAPTACLNANVGCASEHGAILAGDTPVTIDSKTLWQWEGSADEWNDCKLKRLSEPIDELLNSNSYGGWKLFYNHVTDEVWFYKSGVVWAYNRSRNAWYCFTGIYADLCFESADTVGFIHDGKIFVFDENLFDDHQSEHYIQSISAEYRTHPTDFGTDEKKNMARLKLDGNLTGGSITLFLFYDKGSPFQRDLYPSTEDEFGDHLNQRVTSGRFQQSVISLMTYESAPIVIQKLELQTR